MADKKDTAPGGLSVQVSVTLQASPEGETPPQAVAYAFTDTGRYLTSAALDAKGSATLSVPASQSPQQIRVVVGPESSAQGTTDRAPTLSDLTRRGAQEQFVRTGPNAKGLQAVFHLPPEIWRCWIRFCFVKGTLLKRIYSSGVAIDYPVCGADVQIWEVEPIYLIISKLADVQLEKIRQYMLNPQPLPPGPDPGPERFNFNQVYFNPQPDPPGNPDPFRNLGQIEVARPISTLQEFSVASPEFENRASRRAHQRSDHAAAIAGDGK